MACMKCGGSMKKGGAASTVKKIKMTMQTDLLAESLKRLVLVLLPGGSSPTANTTDYAKRWCLVHVKKRGTLLRWNIRMMILVLENSKRTI
jgi:hypothetical protein